MFFLDVEMQENICILSLLLMISVDYSLECFSYLYALISIASFQLRTELKPRSVWKIANRVHLCFIVALFIAPRKENIPSNEFYALLINNEKINNFSFPCTENCAFKCMISSNLDSAVVVLHIFYSSISTPTPTPI